LTVKMALMGNLSPAPKACKASKGFKVSPASPSMATMAPTVCRVCKGCKVLPVRQGHKALKVWDLTVTTDKTVCPFRVRKACRA
jgi:hypothetical protein